MLAVLCYWDQSVFYFKYRNVLDSLDEHWNWFQMRFLVVDKIDVNETEPI